MVKIGATYALLRVSDPRSEFLASARDSVRPMYHMREAIAPVTHTFTTSSNGHPREPRVVRVGVYIPAVG